MKDEERDHMSRLDDIKSRPMEKIFKKENLSLNPIEMLNRMFGSFLTQQSQRRKNKTDIANERTSTKGKN